MLASFYSAVLPCVMFAILKGDGTFVKVGPLPLDKALRKWGPNGGRRLFVVPTQKGLRTLLGLTAREARDVQDPRHPDFEKYLLPTVGMTNQHYVMLRAAQAA